MIIKDYIKVRLYSYSTTVTVWGGVHLRHKQGAPKTWVEGLDLVPHANTLKPEIRIQITQSGCNGEVLGAKADTTDIGLAPQG